MKVRDQISPRLRLATLAAIAVLAPVLLLAAPGPAGATSSRPRPSTPVTPDWSSYLFATDHAGYNPAAAAITPANAASLVRVWHWQPANRTQTGQPLGLYSSPVVYGGRVYVGARTGIFYALDETTGTVVWQRPFGWIAGTTCGPEGFTSTATVAPDPTTGNPAVYVAAPDGYLYAMNASDGSTLWRALVGIPSTTVNDYYNWSSPTVVGGVVYIGIASECDNPLVPGGVIAVDQATGNVIATYHSTPPGKVGASVWGSVLADDNGQIFTSTGNGPTGTDQVSIMRLALDPVAGTLTKADFWTIPKAQQAADSDFGSSPTAFVATLAGVPTEMIGSCNKNGHYYAFRASDIASGPVWDTQIGDAYRKGTGQCDAAAIWDGTRLFAASNSTSIGGVAYKGSIRELDPATGAVLWATGLPGPIIGSPTLDAGGVIAAGAFSSGPGPFLLDSNTGALLETLPLSKGKTFAQSIFTNSGLLLATTINLGITAYRAP